MKKYLIPVGRLEGISFLLILFVTMPLKYMFDSPMPNKVVGMAHGVLFIVYVYFVIIIAAEEKWPRKQLLMGLAASIFPFGTFIFESKYLKSRI